MPCAPRAPIVTDGTAGIDCHARITDNRASRHPAATQTRVPQEGRTRISQVAQRTAFWVAARVWHRLSTRGDVPVASVPPSRQKTRCESRPLLPGRVLSRWPSPRCGRWSRRSRRERGGLGESGQRPSESPSSPACRRRGGSSSAASSDWSQFSATKGKVACVEGAVELGECRRRLAQITETFASGNRFLSGRVVRRGLTLSALEVTEEQF